mmetsp:Transcript_45180/g.88386  ORF Transcript_45180/g.88386 Transcript_45180/m.88386 type:complete len:200 (-) Transcript_45180:437-1036(-)
MQYRADPAASAAKKWPRWHPVRAHTASVRPVPAGHGRSRTCAAHRGATNEGHPLRADPATSRAAAAKSGSPPIAVTKIPPAAAAAGTERGAPSAVIASWGGSVAPRSRQSADRSGRNEAARSIAGAGRGRRSYPASERTYGASSPTMPWSAQRGTYFPSASAASASKEEPGSDSSVSRKPHPFATSRASSSATSATHRG